MKATLACPKCSQRKLWVIDEVTQPRAESSNAVHGLALVTAEPDSSSSIRIQRTRREVGRFEAWVCDACGYTEWYAKKLEGLDKLAREGKGVRLIDPSKPKLR